MAEQPSRGRILIPSAPPESQPSADRGYRGRLAPSPTGYLHLGHARTFWIAQERTLAHGGALVLRNEDLDAARSKSEFVTAMIEDLRWFGLHWQEGPDCGGPFAPYTQSERHGHYRAAFQRLLSEGCVYPCICSRRDVFEALRAPHPGDDEPVYPGTCRTRFQSLLSKLDPASDWPPLPRENFGLPSNARVNWRFRVPDGERIQFHDGRLGEQSFAAARDFGDFVVWRHEQLPSYQLAVVVDDAGMAITEVVRGADLLCSTARQLLLYRALGWRPPRFYHCPLLTDAAGARLAKRHDALSLRTLRAQGATPEGLRQDWNTRREDANEREP